MVKGKETSKEEPTRELAEEFTVEATQPGIKKASGEGSEGAVEKSSEDLKESEGAVEKSSEDLKESEGVVEDSSEDSEEPSKEDSEEPSKEDSEEAVEKSSEDSEESRESEDSEESKESNDSENPQPPAGITDEELSRVFGSLPKKSKVALNRAESKMSSVKNAKSSPVWYPWVFSIIMIIGLIWAVVYYLTGTYPIPHIGVWNLCIAFVTMLVGFSMTMFWK